MGRKIVCPDCGSIVDEDILKAKNSENTCLVCGANLGGDSTNKAEEHADWITWYYYGFKNGDGKSATLSEKKIDLDKHGDTFFLIKEFQAPPEDNPGGLDEVKRILRTYVPNAFAPAEESDGPVIRCPRCGSKEYTLLNKGYGLLTGFIGSGKIKRVCNYCKKEF